ncbi:hypothetical protein PJE062_2197 [Pseudovibrio sp. JE062]|nr:hypothetical protein PJE062_2197 [Pseudovibrio sp. JE062]
MRKKNTHNNIGKTVGQATASGSKLCQHWRD